MSTLIGYIVSVNIQKRFGFIKEKGKNTTYYFGFRSVIDKELTPRVGQVVNFQLYKKNEKEFVAVCVQGSTDSTKTNSDCEYVNAVVNWYSDEKRYGYVTCENSEDAFLHFNSLKKAGVSTVKPKQRIKVKLIESKYPGKKAVSDVIVLNNSRYHPEMLYPREPQYNKSNQNCTANDLTAIPYSLDNQENRLDRSKFVNAMTNPNNISPFARKPGPSDRRPCPPEGDFSRNPGPTDRQPYPPGRDFFRNPGIYDDRSRMPCNGNALIRPGSSGVHNRMPYSLPGQYSHYNRPPNAPAPYIGPSPYANDFCNGPLRTSDPCSGAVRMPCPSTPNQNHHQALYNSNPASNTRPRSGYLPFRHNSPKQKLPITNPEFAKIKQQIDQKENLLKTLNLSKLPDAGQRLRDQIKDLKDKMKNLSMHDEKVVTEIAYPSISNKKVQSTADLNVKTPPIVYDTSAYTKYHHELKKKSEIIQKVTIDAIEKLHTSLSTCPSAVTEISDPDGLKVTLMIHQRQALAWLVWREKQAISGGILADDMGLGKTLTMIALVLLQLASVNEQNSNVDDEDVVKEGTTKDVEAAKVETNTENDDDQEESNKDSSDTESDTFSGITCNSTLIVAPASLIYHWENEIRNRCDQGLLSIHLFHGSEREKDAEKLSEFDIVITTYAIVMRTNPTQKKSKKDEILEASNKQTNPNQKTSKEAENPETSTGEDALFRIRWRRIILDEAHQIRNFKSRTSEGVCLLHAQSRWALSGTPIQNDENDMYAMLKFLHCKPFDEHKLWKQQVCNKTQVGQKRLKTLVSCLVLRREKSQKGPDGKPLVLLPTRTFTTHTLKLSEIEQEVYQKLKEESCTAFKTYEKIKKNKSIPSDINPYSRHYSSPREKLSATNLLVKLLRLRQCCSHLHLLKNSFDLELLESERKQVAVEDLFEDLTLKDDIEDRSFKLEKYLNKDKSTNFEISATSSKLKHVMDKLHQLNFEKPHEKSVIVSQWTGMLRVVAHHLEEAKLNYAVIEGGVTARKRMTLVDEFNRNPIKPKIMLVSLQAGGVGLNLIGGNHLFLLDMHWNPALEKQAFDRIYRVGQTKDVFVHKLVVQGTVDEQILQLQEQKLSVADSIMAGADSENKAKLTLSDMKMLFGI